MSSEATSHDQSGRPEVPSPGSTRPPTDYGADELGLYFIQRVPRVVERNGQKQTVFENSKFRLTNFLAGIKEQQVIDDGEGDEKIRRVFTIEASSAGQGYRFTLDADQFQDLRRWIDTYIGPPATVFPSVKNHLDHVSAAIKILSRTPTTFYSRTHTGWIEVAGVRWFLHQGGMIGPTSPGRSSAEGSPERLGERPTTTTAVESPSASTGPSGPSSRGDHISTIYKTSLPKALRKFDLPVPLEGFELRLGFQAILELVDAASPAVGYSLLGACFSAPLGTSKTYVNLIGSTDSGKSVYAGLFQSLFGSKLDSKNLVAHWGSTGNHIERLLFHAKDTMVVIDDFLTKGQMNDVQRQQAKADQVLRALFNNSGRGRAQGDGSIRDDCPPRAQVVSTAELPFSGLSIKNRGFNLDFAREDLDWDAITFAQEHARTGLFAGVMSSYLRTLSQRYDRMQPNFLPRQEALEELARDHLPGRGRAAGVVASLFIGVEVFLVVGYSWGFLAHDEFSEYSERAWDALIGAAMTQQADHDDPIEFYFTCLQSAFVSGMAYVSSPDGGRPDDLADWDTDLDAWGWHRWKSEDQVKTFDEVDSSVTTRKVAVTTGWRPKGQKIGWLSGSTLYLLPTAALKAAKAVARGIDATIDFTPWTLGKTLYERGLLLRDEAKRKRKRFSARENLGGGRPSVHIIASSNVMAVKAQYPADCRMYDCEDHEIPGILDSFEGLIA